MSDKEENPWGLTQAIAMGLLTLILCAAKVFAIFMVLVLNRNK